MGYLNVAGAPGGLPVWILIGGLAAMPLGVAIGLPALRLRGINLAIVTPYAIWMIKGYIDAVPTESEEAALVDGATRLRVIFDIAAPMIWPGVLVAAVFCFILTWNEFLFALILTGNRVPVITVVMAQFVTEMGLHWNLMAATAVMALLPAFLIAFFGQKYVIRGLRI